MKQKCTNLLAQASLKSSEPAALEEHLPMLDLILERKQDIEAVSAELDLKTMARYLLSLAYMGTHQRMERTGARG